MKNVFAILYVFSVPASVLTGSHSLWVLATYIKGNTPFPEFSATLMLDDIIVGYTNSETWSYFPRGNTTNEEAFDTSDTRSIWDHLVQISKNENHTESPTIYQAIGLCELRDNNKPGQMIAKTAFDGSTTEEVGYLGGKFTYKGPLKYSDDKTDPYLQMFMWYHEMLCFPHCIKTLKTFLKSRRSQVMRKVKPRVRLLKKAISDSGGFRVSCLATGFYPRHINLTLFRDGQPVADHEITGGDLLPNGDGTYQMRKCLEISAADKHKYTCSATHLSLDNKLDIDLENQDEPFQTVISSVLIFLAFVLVFGTGAAIIICKKRHTAKREYSSASSSEEHVDTAS